MRIALIGDGKMAKAIAPRAEERRHTITVMLGEKDNANAVGITRERLGNPDVAIEFTEPSAAVANVLACARAGVPVVVGTTGWYDQIDAVKSEVTRLGGSM